MAAFRHILVATDFSPASSAALEAALALAKRFNAKLCILHVVEPPALSPAPFPYPLPIVAESIEAGRKQLDEVVASARPQRSDCQGILREGLPWKEIVAAVNDLQIDLVVTGSQGRHGLPRWLLGSVAERVVRLSPVAVLTVPSPHGLTEGHTV